MIYTKMFDASTFDWTPDARMVVDKVMSAGKKDEFEEIIKKRFDNEHDTVSDGEINSFVAGNGGYILASVWLDKDGNPIEEPKKYKVFCRVTGTVEEEVEADTPEEARQKVVDEFWDAGGDPLFCMNRDDVETVVPVAYDEGGQTLDYGPSEEQKAELRNALTGAEVWALVRNDFDECGGMDAPTVELFITEELAKGAMRKEYDLMMSYVESKCPPSGNWPFQMVMDPRDGEDTCYIKLKDNRESRWNVRKVDFFQK